MPLARRLPKRGFTNIFKQRYAVVNIRDLQRFEKGSVVDIKALMDSGLVKQLQAGIKLLGEGEIQHPLPFRCTRAAGARSKRLKRPGGKWRRCAYDRRLPEHS